MLRCAPVSISIVNHLSTVATCGKVALHCTQGMMSAQTIFGASRQYEGFLTGNLTKSELCLHTKLLEYNNDSWNALPPANSTRCHTDLGVTSFMRTVVKTSTRQQNGFIKLATAVWQNS